MFTSRTGNVAHHRSIQVAVRSAVGHALRLATALPSPSSPSAAPFAGLPPSPGQLAGGNGNGADGSAGSNCRGSNDRASAGQRDTATERASGAALNGSGTAGSNGAGRLSSDTSSAGTFPGSAPLWQPHCVQVSSASLHQFSLPLAAGLTTVSSIRCTDPPEVCRVAGLCGRPTKLDCHVYTKPVLQLYEQLSYASSAATVATVPAASILQLQGAAGSHRRGLLLTLGWRCGAAQGEVHGEVSPLPGEY